MTIEAMTADRKTISIRRACALADVSRRTIYNWIARGKVEYVRTAGGSIRIFVDTLWRTPEDARSPARTAEEQEQPLPNVSAHLCDRAAHRSDSAGAIQGKPMIKVDLVNAVSKLAALTKVKAEVAVDAVFDAMRMSMQRGERIELRGFGVFLVKPRKRGIGRNPRTGEEFRIPPGRTIRFKPGKDLQNIGG